jgi:hypothetical protein
MGQFTSMLAIVILTPLLFLGLSLSGNFLVSSFLIGLYYSSMSFREVIIDTYLNTRINSRYRATVLSIASMIVSSLAIFVLPLLGNIVDRSSLNAGMWLLAVSTLTLGGLSMIAGRGLGDL